MPQLLHAGLQAALDRLAERHPAGVRRAARNLSIRHPVGWPNLPLIVGRGRAQRRARGGLQMSRMLALACVLAAFALAAGSASAQQPSGTSQQPAPTPPYGPPITLEQAKRVMAAAELEAAGD